ncbi:hypothetical protein [Nocardia sputi]|nr:hypothetical protein [Nocardia sputi]
MNTTEFVSTHVGMDGRDTVEVACLGVQFHEDIQKGLTVFAATRLIK